MLISDQADFVFCRGTLFGDDRPERPIKSTIAQVPGIDPFIYFANFGVGTEAPLHRRRCLESIGGFREHLPRAQEGDLHVRLGAADVRLHFVDEILYRHRNHESAQRITGKPMQSGYLCQFFLEIADILESGPPYRMTLERRAACSSALFQQSIYAFRNGATDVARQGFKRSLQLYPEPEYVERRWYKTLVRIVGPTMTEQILCAARGLLHGNKRSA